VAMRKLLLMGNRDQKKITTTGFDSKGHWINTALGTLSRLEWIPQKLLGTSLMAVLGVLPGKSTGPAR
jgi:hypothetical protein